MIVTGRRRFRLDEHVAPGRDHANTGRVSRRAFSCGSRR